MIVEPKGHQQEMPPARLGMLGWQAQCREHCLCYLPGLWTGSCRERAGNQPGWNGKCRRRWPSGSEHVACKAKKGHLQKERPRLGFGKARERYLLGVQRLLSVQPVRRTKKRMGITEKTSFYSHQFSKVHISSCFFIPPYVVRLNCRNVEEDANWQGSENWTRAIPRETRSGNWRNNKITPAFCRSSFLRIFKMPEELFWSRGKKQYFFHSYYLEGYFYSQERRVAKCLWWTHTTQLFLIILN